MDDEADPDALLLARERALVGAALLDPVAADLLLAELSPRDLICSVAEAVLRSLKALRAEDPVRYATEPALGLVLEDLELSGVLTRLDELGGRGAVEALTVDRPELREARASLRSAAARIVNVEDEPLVQLAAVELGVVEQADDGQLDPIPAVTGSRQLVPSSPIRALPSTSPVTVSLAPGRAGTTSGPAGGVARRPHAPRAKSAARVEPGAPQGPPRWSR